MLQTAVKSRQSFYYLTSLRTVPLFQPLPSGRENTVEFTHSGRVWHLNSSHKSPFHPSGGAKGPERWLKETVEYSAGDGNTTSFINSTTFPCLSVQGAWNLWIVTSQHNFNQPWDCSTYNWGHSGPLLPLGTGVIAERQQNPFLATQLQLSLKCSHLRGTTQYVFNSLPQLYKIAVKKQYPNDNFLTPELI